MPFLSSGCDVLDQYASAEQQYTQTLAEFVKKQVWGRAITLTIMHGYAVRSARASHHVCVCACVLTFFHNYGDSRACLSVPVIMGLLLLRNTVVKC